MQYSGGGTAKNVSRSDGLIIPDMIPGDDLSPEGIRTSATAMRTAASTMQTQSTSIDTTWTALPASFVAPDAAVLYAAMSPASVKAREFASKLTRVSAALDDFAHAIEPIKKTLAVIKADAISFTNEIGQDGLVWVNARETKAYEWDSRASYSSYGHGYGYGGYGSAGTGTATAADPVSYLRGLGESARSSGGVVQILASWKESGHYVGRNNDLLDRVADAYAKVNAAEVECANTINRERDICMAPLVAVEAWQLKQDGDDVAKLPWGHRVDEDRNCGENFGNGIVIAAVGAVEGLGSLVGYNPTKGEWGDGEHAGQSWLGVATGIGSLALSTMPFTPVLASMGVPLFTEAQNTTTEMFKGLVAWDRWEENPSEAFGQSLFNVGTMFIPVGGLVAGGVKVISGSAKAGTIIANTITKIEHVGVRVVEGVENTAHNVKKLVENLKSRIPSDLFPEFDADSGSGVKPNLTIDKDFSGPPLRVDSESNANHLPKGDNDGSANPAPKGDNDGSSPAHRGDNDNAPAPKGDNDSTPAPKSDNDNAPAGKGDADGVPGNKGDGVDTPPVKGDADGAPPAKGDVDAETPGTGKPDTDDGTPPRNDDSAEPAPGNKPDAATPAPHVHHDSVDGDAPSGDGWTRTSIAEEERMFLEAQAKRDAELRAAGLAPDAPYGEVQANSLSEAPLPPRPADVRGTGYETVGDPGAPWGRNASGEPYTEKEYASRFTQTGDGNVRYPDYDGVVPGTRITFSDPVAYLKEFGASFDRVGGMWGRYFGVVEDGRIASFEQRGLPIDNLGDKYFAPSFTDDAASIMKENGIRIEVSRIAPAFGREGGALQVRFIDANGDFLRGTKLVEDGIFSPVS